MSTTPVGGDPVVADPKKPYKAIAGALITFLGLLWANVQGADNLKTVGDWITILVPTILAFGAIYGIANPVVARRAGRRGGV